MNGKFSRNLIFPPIIALAFLLIFALTACNSNTPEVIDNLADFANVPSVEIDGAILQACYFYAESLGIEIKEKENYKSVLLGESRIDAVYVDDDVNAEMVDANDYLIVFQEIKVVIDAETGIAIGRIPYV